MVSEVIVNTSTSTVIKGKGKYSWVGAEVVVDNADANADATDVDADAVIVSTVVFINTLQPSSSLSVVEEASNVATHDDDD